MKGGAETAQNFLCTCLGYKNLRKNIFECDYVNACVVLFMGHMVGILVAMHFIEFAGTVRNKFVDRRQ